mgnify:CR=1 FL=1
MPEILSKVDSKNFEVKALLYKNVLISGDFDSGKTLLLKRLAEEYIREGVPLILIDTVYEHKSKSLIAYFELNDAISAKFDGSNIDYATVREVLTSSKPVVAINLSSSLEASNVPGIEESLRKAIRNDHLQKCGNIAKLVVEQVPPGKMIVIISDEVDYPEPILKLLLSNKSIILIMVPNELSYSAADFDVWLTTERPKSKVKDL